MSLSESEPDDDPTAGAGMSVTVELHELDPKRLDQEALAAGVAAAVSILGDPKLRVVVSGAFQDYVRENDEVLSGLPPYVQERVRGHAVGKILKLADGTKTLLVDASILDIDRERGTDPVRVFMHEAAHLLIGRRGESTTGRRARMGFTLGTAEGAFAGIAGQIGEECRVERALSESGHPLESGFRAELDAMANDYAESLREPFWAYQHNPGSDTLGPLSDAAINGFNHLTPIVAYLVGDDLGAGARRPPSVQTGTPSEWFRDGYDRLRGPLAALPSADEPCPLEHLDSLLEPVAEALKDWFAAIGFRWTGGPSEYRFELLDVDRLAVLLAE